jgi:hypothetical protein
MHPTSGPTPHSPEDFALTAVTPPQGYQPQNWQLGPYPSQAVHSAPEPAVIPTGWRDGEPGFKYYRDNNGIDSQFELSEISLFQGNAWQDSIKVYVHVTGHGIQIKDGHYVPNGHYHIYRACQ